MENSKKRYTPMIEKHVYRKSQGAQTPSEVQHMRRVPYASAIGSIMYAVRCTRPDVAFAQNLCSRFQQNPDKDNTKSQTGYVFILNGAAMDWKSAKKSTTAMSSIEAEYIVAVEASIEAVWMRKFIDELRDGARHFQRKYHYIRKVIQEHEIVLKKVHTDDNVVDPFTKPMPFNKHYEHAMAIGIIPASSLM
ncbi:hypothetical protein Tco_1150912 [Tanacetum coccineum]